MWFVQTLLLLTQVMLLLVVVAVAAVVAVAQDLSCSLVEVEEAVVAVPVSVVAC